MCLNPHFQEAVSHRNWLWNYVTEMPSFYGLLERSVRLPPFLLPILSTPLDFNHRYSRGSANECSSPRVHPKVTHLKPRSTPRETLPHHRAYFDTTLMLWIKHNPIQTQYWMKCYTVMNLLCCVFQFVFTCFQLRWQVAVNEHLMISEQQWLRW